MKHRKSFVLAILIGMVLLAVAVSIAQTTSQQTNQKQADSCCAMESCCCHGGSCPMKTGEKTDAKAADCCCGDSCDMKNKQDANHASKGCCCCPGDSKATAATTAQGASSQSTKHECCAAMATNMTAKHDMKKMKTHDMKNMKNHDMKDGCCCCGDSCDMDMKKTAN